MSRRLRAFAIAAALACCAASCATRSMPSQCIVSTPDGDVQGLDRDSFCAYLGIPYAAPPVGELRWRLPQPARPWTPATLKVTSEPPLCAQVSPEGSGTSIGSEDCLTLSIWTPNPRRGSPSPVIV
jgi:para-nitrobenzyl esterase